MNRSTRLPEWVAQHPIAWGVVTGSFLVALALFMTEGEYPSFGWQPARC